MAEPEMMAGPNRTAAPNVTSSTAPDTSSTSNSKLTTILSRTSSTAGGRLAPKPSNQNLALIIGLSVTVVVLVIVIVAGALFWKCKQSNKVNPDNVYDKNGVTVTVLPEHSVTPKVSDM